MYSTTIKSKVDAMFDELGKKVSNIVAESFTSNEAINNATKMVSSELATRSKSILSDMLFALSDSLMNTEFFTDKARQNRFYEINLRQEILSKYQFAPSISVNHKEASKEIHALKVGGAVFVAGSIVGVVLTAGRSLSKLIPVPIGVLVVASIGAALVDYYAIAPDRNKKALSQALDNYLFQVEKQFLEWFDEIENYFNERVEEIKQTM